MRADNDGRRRHSRDVRSRAAPAHRRRARGLQSRSWLALAGTALFFCDALITPAISVLSAVEGLELLNPSFAQHGRSDHGRRDRRPVRLPEPRHGAHRRASSAPIMVVWFVVIGLTGAAAIRRDPVVLAAINPRLRHRAARAPPGRRARDHRRGVPRHHRRRGALRRHGTLRQGAGAHRAGSRSSGPR